MGWLIVICTGAIIITLSVATARLLNALDELRVHLQYLRKETVTGLGVESKDGPKGYRAGGYLEVLAADVRDRQKRERQLKWGAERY